MKKTIFALVLSLIMVVSVAITVNASSPEVVVGSGTACPGQEVTLYVTLRTTTTLNQIALDFEENLNSALEFKNSVWMSAIINNDPKMDDAGAVPIVVFEENKDIVGSILKITFKVKDNASINDVIAITPLIDVKKVTETGSQVRVPTMVTGGSITIVCPGHIPETDDGDCTTPVYCSIPGCGHTVVPGNAAHTPEADDGDCTSAVKCQFCDQIVVEANATHTPEADDGDCTSAVKCQFCDQIVVEAKQHIDANGDGICDNDGCTVPQAVACDHTGSKTTHYSVDKEPTCNEPGFGTTWVRCAGCGHTLSKESYLIPATNKHVDENKDGKCDVCGNSLVTEHVHELEHVEAKAATCTENGNIEYWYCAGCDSYFTDAEGKNKVDAADVVVPAAHKVEHVPAKEATETEDGNIEYWHCPECGGIWLDADCTTAAKLEDVIIPATGVAEHVHELVHTEAKAATCFEEGNLEYWYCAGCDCYFTDAEGKYNIAYLSLILPVAHKVEHVAAKAPTCFEEGNIEYWYCTECGYAWLDEFCTKNTNLLAVILPVSHKIVHVEAKAPTATENGNIEYWYCTECGYAWLDELCTKNTNLKAVILPATGEDINPPTGDATILYIAAVAVIATLGVAVISFKKREEN